VRFADPRRDRICSCRLDHPPTHHPPGSGSLGGLAPAVVPLVPHRVAHLEAEVLQVANVLDVRLQLAPGAADGLLDLVRLWGEAEDAFGARAVSRMRTPEGYAFTAVSAVAIALRMLAGEAPPGFQTPSRAYGADFVLAIPGVSRTDEPVARGGSAPA